MSVFNGERFLAEAIESILNQTFRDFEFIIINDGSTDGTADVLARYQKIDPRVAVHHQPNKGLIESLNTGCNLAQGCYIARMDADDISIDERLDRQVKYFAENPQVALLGSSVNIIDDSGRQVSVLRFPTGNKGIKEWVLELHQVPFSHPTLVFRTEVIRAVKGYRRAFVAAEDYDLVIRIAERWQVANLAEPVIKMRRHANSVSITNVRQQVSSILGAWAAANIRRASGYDPTDSAEVISRKLLSSMGVSDAVFEESLMGAYIYWIDMMLQGSDKAGALRLMREALESQPWKHINNSIVSNMWLAAAYINFEQGRRLQGISCASRALAARPIIAARPIKRIASRLGFLNKGDRSSCATGGPPGRACAPGSINEN